MPSARNPKIQTWLPRELAPHPATIAQPKRPFESASGRPPHPATVAQPRPAQAFGGLPVRPPHPATVADRATSHARMSAPPEPHDATTAQPFVESALAAVWAYKYWIAGSAIALWALSYLTRSTIKTDIEELENEAKDAVRAGHDELAGMIREALYQAKTVSLKEGKSSMGGAQATATGSWSKRTYDLIIDVEQFGKNTVKRRYSILHELWHVAVDRAYGANKALGDEKLGPETWTLNLIGAKDEPEKKACYDELGEIGEIAWDLRKKSEKDEPKLTALYQHLYDRLAYATITATQHYDVVLSELYYYLFVTNPDFLNSSKLAKAIVAGAKKAQKRRLTQKL